MRRTFIASLLAFFLMVAPMSIPAQAVCLNPVILNGVSVCAKTPLDPLVDPLVAPLNRQPVVGQPQQPSQPPTNNNGARPQPAPNKGSQANPEAPRVVPESRTETGAEDTPEAPAQKKPVKKSKPEPTVKPDDEPLAPEVQYKFKTRPWYFWVTVLVGMLGVGFLLFYDTESDKKGRSLVDRARRRVLR